MADTLPSIAAALDAQATRRRTLQGITLALGAIFIFACQDAITKYLSLRYPVPFFLMIRYWAFALFAIVFAARAAGGLTPILRTAAPFTQIFRALLLVVEMGIFAVGLRYLKLVEMHAVFAAFPLMVTALSVPLLSEQVGWRRWLAVAAGFSGVLIILRPGFGVFQMAALIPLAMAFMFALYTVLTRKVSRYDTFPTTFLYTAVIGAVAVSFVGPFYWVTPLGVDWIWIGVLCLTGMTSHFFLIKALEFAPASVLQPFNYMALVWAAIIGFAVFAEVPDGFTIAGGAVVALSGLYVIWRERVRAARG